MITTYTELVAAVGQNWPDRTDLTGRQEEFIALAEAAFKRDPRFRKLNYTTLTVAQDAVDLPSDIREIEDWSHDDGTYFGEIEVVPFGQLAELKRRYGQTGVPQFAAIVNDVAYFAPVADATYSTKFVYWRKIAPLSETVPSNWLLQEAPDAYLYGALIHLEGFLKNDARITTWKTLYEEIAEQMHKDADSQQFGGTLRRRNRTIG
jgi:hypothetical protein